MEQLFLLTLLILMLKKVDTTLLEKSLKLVHILHDGLKILISLNKKIFGMSYAINSII